MHTYYTLGPLHFFGTHLDSKSNWWRFKCIWILKIFLGGVYAIGDIAFCLGFAVGPALSGSLVQHFGFKAMMVGIGIISFFYGPLLFLLKDPPPRTEQDKQETTVIS